MSAFDVLVTEPPSLAVTVTEAPAPCVDVSGPASPGVVEVRVPGPAGPKGDPGVSPVGGSDAHFAHPQSVPSALWTVAHNLGKRPSVQVLDSAGTQVEGDVAHVDANNLTVTFAFPFSGVAYLN